MASKLATSDDDYEYPDYEVNIFEVIPNSYKISATVINMLNIFSTVLSMIVFFRLKMRTPLYLILLALTGAQFLRSAVDCIEFLTELSSDRYVFGDVAYPMRFFLLMIEAWLMVLTVIDIWRKTQNRIPWGNLEVNRRISIIIILCLALNMAMLFDPKIVLNDQSVKGYIQGLYLALDCLLPSIPIIGFGIWTAYHIRNKPQSSLTFEESCEKGRTKVVLLLAICFLLTNTVADFQLMFWLISPEAYWEHSQVLLPILHFQMLIQSAMILIYGVFYFIFLPDYRQKFAALFCTWLRGCGCMKLFPAWMHADKWFYNELERNAENGRLDERED